ncbi:pyridoxal kinase [Holotrichia oblita]|uniref:Pyridoxal kinase n=1 Tax=Holotrichia oblita TaxID=644536 RepID=A0ACB9TE78_HOLOL|nr:pyridoxal kinase [Holotrichia oblita]
MGDNGKMYVPKELLPVYKDVLVPLADILTPNQFEIELLTGCSINTIDDDWKACEMRSSSNLENNSNLLTLASSRVGAGIKLSTEIPKLSTSFVGSGDLFACLFLAWSYKTNNNIKVASEKTIATLQRVLKRTEQYAKIKGITPQNMELKLIQSKSNIEDPHVELFATEL